MNAPQLHKKCSARCRGLSLVELMVAMTVGLIVMLAVGEVYLNSSRTYRNHDALSRLQENARYALETLSYDIRMAGQVGCGYDKTQSVNVLEDVSYGDLFDKPILGIKAGGPIPAPFDAVPLIGDSIQIMRADEENESVVKEHKAASANIEFSEDVKILKDDILIITDCVTAAVFQASGPTTLGNKVVHNKGDGDPGNCTKDLGPKPLITDPCASATQKDFLPGSKVYKMLNHLYYIRANPANEPALYRQTLVMGVPETQELVEGVEDMRISYGLDTTGDRSVDITKASSEMGASEWAQIQTVQISLLLRSDDNVVDQPQAYTFNGAPTTPTDRRLRKVFNATIAVRSRQ